MSFYGSSIIFDNISSERYGLHIAHMDSKSTISVSNYKSEVIKTNRQNVFYPKRQTIEEPLTLNISLYSKTPLTRNQIDQIENWLYSPDGEFKELRIEQDDMRDWYYNCRLIKLEVDTYYNQPQVIQIEMQCDSIYVWQNKSIIKCTISSTPYTYKFINYSSEKTLKPIYTLTCNSAGGTIKIVNSAYTDIKENTMEFKNLYNGEILTIDTEHEIIISNLRTSGLLDLFTNINFMRLPKGKNDFTITGNINEFKFTYKNCRKVGD